MYKDRGIMKWAPFDALSGFNERIKDLKYKLGKKDKPDLLEDKLESLDRTIKEALKDDLELIITYFKDGYFITTYGFIKKIDLYKRTIYLTTKETIFIDDVISLECVL